MIDRYPHLLTIPTRWNDNDVYGHVNNIEYYSFFDTVINHWLITEGGLDIEGGAAIGFCAESHCTYKAPLSFPEPVAAGLRVADLGRSSVRYEIGLFRAGAEAGAEPGNATGDDGGPAPPGELAAEGWFVHVFVDRESQRPVAIPDPIRGSLERLLAGGGAER